MATAIERKKNKLTKLVDLDVSRIDGVDSPATGRRFLLWKSRDEGRIQTALASGRPVKVVRKDGGHVTLREKPNGRIVRVKVDKTTDVPSRRPGRFACSFADVLGVGRPIAKSQPVADGIRTFSINGPDRGVEPVDSTAMDTEDARMGRVLQGWSGKGSIHEPAPEHPRDSFLYGESSMTAGSGTGAPMGDQYTVQYPYPVEYPSNLNYKPGSNPAGLVAPADFSRPRPGAVRAGDGSVRKGMPPRRRRRPQPRRRAQGDGRLPRGVHPRGARGDAQGAREARGRAA
jgi:hypothetical protein